MRRHFSKEKEFIKTLSQTFGIEPDGSRAGVVTFSYNAELSIKLSDHANINSFQEAISKLPFMGYTTRIDRALELVRDKFFLPANGGRSRVPKIVFIVTDGTQTLDLDAKRPSGIAAQIRQKYGAVIFSIGIGNHVNRDELARIANGESRVFLAKNFAELKSTNFVSKIEHGYCQGRYKSNQSVHFAFVFWYHLICLFQLYFNRLLLKTKVPCK